MARQLTCPVGGAVTFSVTAGHLDLDVTVDQDVKVAAVEMTGPPGLLARAEATITGGSTWQLRMPQDGPAHANGVSITSGTVFVGEVMSFSSVTNLGAVRGRIVVNGVDVTDAVRASQPEPLTVRARLPQRSSLIARVVAGNVAARGELAGAQVDTTSADAEIQAARSVQARSVSGDISVGVCGGPADVCATSGDIEIEDARGAVRAASTSGDIRVHVTRSVHVDASTTSGDVRVTAAAGVHPQVSGYSISGRVRTPENPRTPAKEPLA